MIDIDGGIVATAVASPAWRNENANLRGQGLDEMKHLPPLVPDPIIEAYKKDVDRTLLRENLKLSVEQRLTRMYEFMRSLDAVRGSARRSPGFEESRSEENSK